MKFQYVIPECNLPTLSDLLDKANKQAKKLGLDEVTFTNDGIAYRQMYVADKKFNNNKGWVSEENLDPERYTEQGQVRNWLTITVDGETPKFSGWTFCATLMPVPTDNGIENQIRQVPGVDIQVPKEYRDRAGECDHCNTNRRRNETYVVHSEDEGFKMVGSSCLKDFLGHSDPHAIARYLELLYQCSHTCSTLDEEEYYSGGTPDAFKALSVLSKTSAVVSAFGWTSKKEAWDNQCVSTAARTHKCFLQPKDLSDADTKMVKKCVVTPEDLIRADNIFAWIKAIDSETNNDYMYNLSLLSRSDYITFKSFGILCSAVSAYDRAMNRKAEETQYVNSEHIGKVKDRFELDVTVNKIFEKEGEWGLTRIHHMSDSNGNYLVWFASGEPLKVGETHKVKATVKSHNEFNGVKQTILTRVSKVREKVVNV